MLLRTAILIKYLITFGAGIWLFTCVDPFKFLRVSLTKCTFHIWNMQKAFALYMSFYVYSLHHLFEMCCHIWSTKMASLLCVLVRFFQLFTSFKWFVTFGTGKYGFSPMWVLSRFFKCSLCIMYLYHHSVFMPFYKFSSQMTFLPCESSHVSSINTLFECLVTFGADKWLFCCEDPFMILQITTCLKCIHTIAVGKWLLSCVSFCVSSNCYFLQMSFYMASLSCESSSVFSIYHYPWMPCHIWSW